MKHDGGGWLNADRIPGVLFAAGGGLCLVLLVEIGNQILTVSRGGPVSPAELPWAYVLSFTISLPFIGGILYGARYLSTEPFPRERNHRILKWCLGGMAVWLGINVLTMLSFGVVSLWPVVGWVRGALAWGGAFGLLAGIIEARAISNAIEREQAAVRAKLLAERQETFDYLASMLRHEVLNSASVIHGYATLLAEDLPASDSQSEYIHPIVNQSDDIISFVKESRQVMESLSHTPEFEPVDLAEMLEEEARKTTEIEPTAVVTVDAPADVYVWGDGILDRIFGNLLSNAVEHAEREEPRVTVSVDAGPDSVTVTVADNGPGIDEETRETLFERPTETGADHGFGLYIVSQLCERYCGSVSLHETGPEGTAFRVTLRRAAPPGDPESPQTREPEAVRPT